MPWTMQPWPDPSSGLDPAVWQAWQAMQAADAARQDASEAARRSASSEIRIKAVEDKIAKYERWATWCLFLVLLGLQIGPEATAKLALRLLGLAPP